MTSDKNIFKISYPIFLTLAAQNIINVTDTAFPGRVRELELGKFAIAGVLLIVPVMVFIFTFPELFARIYTNDISLIEGCAPVIHVVSVAMIMYAVGSIIFNALSGTGNTRTAFLIEFFVLFFYPGFIYYTAIVSPTTTAVVCMPEFVYWIPTTLLSYIFLLKGNWKKRNIKLSLNFSTRQGC